MTTTPCGEGKTGSKTTTCDASCSGPINCKTTGECADVVVPDPDCTDGQTSGSQECNGCGTQTTQKCVGGKWTDSLGTCSKTVAECAPEEDCSDAAYKASHKSQCCVGMPETDNICYQTCDCTLWAGTIESRKLVGTLGTSCEQVSMSQCTWKVPSEYGSYPTSQQCNESSYLLRIHPEEGTGVCTWVDDSVSGRPGCKMDWLSTSGGPSGRGCVVPTGAQAPKQQIYSQKFKVEKKCRRCKNGW